jgi:nitroimidazol reductase NimA-like FMN-containing flavoprotein (pyridoxamine 5'-phosphate oxidase superfamily)
MSDAPTDRTQVKRLPLRGRYDRETIDAILDEALICHLAWVQDGSPRIIPTIHARDGDTLYVHGSQASRTLRAARDGAEVCVEATLLDGIVLARSAFHSSMNYRSVVVYGRAREVSDPDEKWHAQQVLVDHVVHGRSEHVRMPNETELKQTMILAVPLDESSAKVRTGPAKDDEEDYELPIWSGVLPMRLEPGELVPDPRLLEGLTPPENVTRYTRDGRLTE